MNMMNVCELHEKVNKITEERNRKAHEERIAFKEFEQKYYEKFVEEYLAKRISQLTVIPKNYNIGYIVLGCGSYLRGVVDSLGDFYTDHHVSRSGRVYSYPTYNLAFKMSPWWMDVKYQDTSTLTICFDIDRVNDIIQDYGFTLSLGTFAISEDDERYWNRDYFSYAPLSLTAHCPEENF